MWWPSSALMAAATISACNGSRVHAVGVVVLLITWKSRRTSGKAGWVSRSCWYVPRTFSLASNRRGLPLRPYAWLKEAQPCQFTNSLLLNLKPQPWSTCTLTCRFNFDTQQISKFCLFCIQSSWSSSSLACLVWFFTGFILTRGYETLPQFVEDLAPQL